MGRSASTCLSSCWLASGRALSLNKNGWRSPRDFPASNIPYRAMEVIHLAQPAASCERYHREAQAEAGHRRFPADIADVGRSGKDVIRGRQGTPHRIGEVSAVTTSKRFAFLATGAAMFRLLLISLALEWRGSPQQSAFLVAPAGYVMTDRLIIAASACGWADRWSRLSKRQLTWVSVIGAALGNLLYAGEDLLASAISGAPIECSTSACACTTLGETPPVSVMA